MLDKFLENDKLKANVIIISGNNKYQFKHIQFVVSYLQWILLSIYCSKYFLSSIGLRWETQWLNQIRFSNMSCYFSLILALIYLISSNSSIKIVFTIWGTVNRFDNTFDLAIEASAFIFWVIHSWSFTVFSPTNVDFWVNGIYSLSSFKTLIKFVIKSLKEIDQRSFLRVYIRFDTDLLGGILHL